MTHLFALNQRLQSRFWPTDNKFLLEAILILFGVALLGLSAQVVIPLKPVPLTFQSAAVILVGMLYGARLSMLTTVSYLILGGLGLPLFAGMASGFDVFTGATAGYLVGFVPAAWMSGYLAERGWGKHVVTAFLAACAGVSIVFLLGVIVLAQFIGWHKAFLLGVMPFMLTEPVKLFAVALIAPRCWKKSV